MQNFYEPYRVLVIKSETEAKKLFDALSIAREEVSAQIELKTSQMQDDAGLIDRDPEFKARFNKLIEARSYLYEIEGAIAPDRGLLKGKDQSLK